MAKLTECVVSTHFISSFFPYLCIYRFIVISSSSIVAGPNAYSDTFVVCSVCSFRLVNSEFRDTPTQHAHSLTTTMLLLEHLIDSLFNYHCSYSIFNMNYPPTSMNPKFYTDINTYPFYPQTWPLSVISLTTAKAPRSPKRQSHAQSNLPLASTSALSSAMPELFADHKELKADPGSSVPLVNLPKTVNEVQPEPITDPVTGAVTFPCPYCDKKYGGKHARSIWRRHLQDKHEIPLALQPRKTRWDNGELHHILLSWSADMVYSV